MRDVDEADTGHEPAQVFAYLMIKKKPRKQLKALKLQTTIVIVSFL